MTQIPFFIFTNSSYSHLWPIINDKLKNFSRAYLCLDDDLNFKFEKNIRVIKYDVNELYTKRVSACLNVVDEEYIIFLHDVDIILNFNFTTLQKYMSMVVKNGVDRLSLGVFNGNTGFIGDEGHAITRLQPGMSQNFLTPFDYAPSVYLRKSLQRLYQNFNETYGNFELNNETQGFVLNSMNSFGIQKTSITKLVYHRGFVYTKDFNFLHITVKGKFMEEEKYFDLKEDFKEIKSRYGLKLEVGNSSHIRKNEI